MNAEHPGEDGTLAPAELVEINRVCDRFKAAWRAGRRPSAEDHLGETIEPARAALLRELLAIELECRKSARERPDLAEYRARFPADAALVDAAFVKAGVAPRTAEECSTATSSRATSSWASTARP